MSFSKKYFGVFFYCLSLSSPLNAMIGEFGGVFVDTLNFSHQVRVRLASSTSSSATSAVELRTGQTGTMFYIDGKPFDMDAIHTQLHQSTEKARKEVLGAGSDAPNAVMAGLTLVVQCGDKLEAFYQPLPEVFRSGSVERAYQNKQTTVIQ